MVTRDSLCVEGHGSERVKLIYIFCNMNCCVYIMSPCLHFELPLFTLQCSSRCLAKTLCHLHQVPSKVLLPFRGPCLSASPLCLCDQFSRGPARFRMCSTQLTQPPDKISGFSLTLRVFLHLTKLANSNPTGFLFFRIRK